MRGLKSSNYFAFATISVSYLWGAKITVVLLGFGSRFKPLLAIVEGQATVGEW